MATHWIDSATIDGFRNLRDLRLEGVGSVNVFVGDNNSGKTSVLEALSILVNFDYPPEWRSMVARRDLGRLDETRTQSIKWSFGKAHSNKLESAIFSSSCRLSCSGKLGEGTLRVTCEDIFDKNPYYPEEVRDVAARQISIDEIRRGVEITHFLEGLRSSTTGAGEIETFDQIWEDEQPSPNKERFLRAQGVESETLTPYSYQINRLQVSRLSEGRLKHSVGPLLKLLQEFDPQIEDIQIESLRGIRPSIYITHSRLGSAPLSIFGDALRRAVLLATTILSFENGGILFVDEIETGIHIQALQRVFSWLSKIAAERNVQVFATTHSLEALDAILFGTPESKNQTVVFRLNQTPDKTVAKRFEGDLLSRIRSERGLDVR